MISILPNAPSRVGNTFGSYYLPFHWTNSKMGTKAHIYIKAQRRFESSSCRQKGRCKTLSWSLSVTPTLSSKSIPEKNLFCFLGIVNNPYEIYVVANFQHKLWHFKTDQCTNYPLLEISNADCPVLKLRDGSIKNYFIYQPCNSLVKNMLSAFVCSSKPNCFALAIFPKEKLESLSKSLFVSQQSTLLETLISIAFTTMKCFYAR